eukprot:5914653-Amphidinium_carterae.1
MWRSPSSISWLFVKVPVSPTVAVIFLVNWLPEIPFTALAVASVLVFVARVHGLTEAFIVEFASGVQEKDQQDEELQDTAKDDDGAT